MSDLTARVRPAAQLADDEAALWRSFLAADPALSSPFLRPEVLVALGRRRPDVHVAVLERGGDVVGFLPFERRRLGLARAAGHGVLDQQALVAAPGTSWRGAEVLAACGLVAWEFDHLLGAQVAAFGPGRVARHPSPVVDLSDGHASWLAGRRAASGGLKTAVQKQRKLGRELPDVRFELDCREPRALEALVAWKSEQYRRTSRRDRFSQPWFTGLAHDLADLRSEGLAGLVSVLWSGERVLAVHLGLRSGDTFASWMPAYDVTASRYSPGAAALLHLVEELAGAGVRVVDLGKGEEDYKRYFANADVVVAAGEVRRTSVVASARGALTAPRRLAEQAVLSSPPLRRAAREALRRAGAVRALASRRP